MKTEKSDSKVWLSPLVMDQGFGVQFRDDHVHVEIRKDFKVTPEQQNVFWNVVRTACEKHNSKRVLVEGFVPEGERDTRTVIDAGQRTGVVPKLWLAFCLVDFRPTERSELFETIAASRGVRVRFFANTAVALSWLRSNAPR